RHGRAAEVTRGHSESVRFGPTAGQGQCHDLHCRGEYPEGTPACSVAASRNGGCRSGIKSTDPRVPKNLSLEAGNALKLRCEFPARGRSPALPTQTVEATTMNGPIAGPP